MIIIAHPMYCPAPFFLFPLPRKTETKNSKLVAGRIWPPRVLYVPTVQVVVVLEGLWEVLHCAV